MWQIRRHLTFQSSLCCAFVSFVLISVSILKTGSSLTVCQPRRLSLLVKPPRSLQRAWSGAAVVVALLFLSLSHEGLDNLYPCSWSWLCRAQRCDPCCLRPCGGDRVTDAERLKASAVQSLPLFYHSVSRVSIIVCKRFNKNNYLLSKNIVFLDVKVFEDPFQILP